MCRFGEVAEHKCDRCSAEFCSRCHGVLPTSNVLTGSVKVCICDDELTPVERPERLGDRAKKRPANYAELSAEEQWAIDKELGLLDWDGK